LVTAAALMVFKGREAERIDLLPQVSSAEFWDKLG
jgi:hypothetical protein